MNADEFMQGQRDCRSNKECPTDASEDYKRGYRAEYERQQILDVMTGWGIS